MIVKVYWNSNKKCWSVLDKKGKLFKHVASLKLKNAHFKVLESGRQKVLTERKKGVHAFAIGEWDGKVLVDAPTELIEVYYNPYLTREFVIRENPIQAVTDAPEVFFFNKKVFIER